MKILKHWKLLLTLGLVFVAGAASGIVWTHVQLKRGFEASLSYDNWINGITESLQRELELTPEQLPKVRALVEGSATEMKASLSRTATEASGIIARFRERLNAELSLEQRQIHERMSRDFDEHIGKKLNLEPAAK